MKNNKTQRKILRMDNYIFLLYAPFQLLSILNMLL